MPSWANGSAFVLNRGHHIALIPLFSCEGVGLGSIRSPLGIVGVWSTVGHGAEDPTGERTT